MRFSNTRPTRRVSVSREGYMPLKRETKLLRRVQKAFASFGHGRFRRRARRRQPIPRRKPALSRTRTRRPFFLCDYSYSSYDIRMCAARSLRENRRAKRRKNCTQRAVAVGRSVGSNARKKRAFRRRPRPKRETDRYFSSRRVDSCTRENPTERFDLFSREPRS